MPAPKARELGQITHILNPLLSKTPVSYLITSSIIWPVNEGAFGAILHAIVYTPYMHVLLAYGIHTFFLAFPTTSVLFSNLLQHRSTGI